jgi:Oxygen-sensitive ribonucleoside-triphosphate reductase
MFEQIKKRDGRVAAFDSSKITNALIKAGEATKEFNGRDAKKMTMRVLTLARELQLGPIPEVEEIQDIVERVLLDSRFKQPKHTLSTGSSTTRSGKSPSMRMSASWNLTSAAWTGRSGKTQT